MLPRLRGLGALALLLALLGGGLGLPLFDALVFHAQPVPTADSTLNADGAPQAHTQLCILDQAGLLTPSIGSMGHATPRLAAVPAATPVARDGAASSHNPLLLPRLRAPPVA